jgi:hypothetical protein
MAGHALLAEEVSEEPPVDGHLDCFVVLPTPVTLERNLPLGLRLVHHTFGEHEAVKEIEVRLHEQNGPQFVDLDNSCLLF